MRKKFSFFLLATVFLVAACGGAGGGGGSSSGGSGGGGDTDTGSGNITPDNGTCRSTALTYTTVEGMPIYVNYRLEVDNEGPVVRFNLGCNQFVEIDVWPVGTVKWITTESASALPVSMAASPGTSVSLAGGFVFTYNARSDSTITTPSGETLRFLWGLSRSTLNYSNSAGVTFIGEVENSPTSDPRDGYGVIWLTVNGTDYGSLGYEPGAMDTGNGIVGYSAEGGHKWGFDPAGTGF